MDLTVTASLDPRFLFTGRRYDPSTHAYDHYYALTLYLKGYTDRVQDERTSINTSDEADVERADLASTATQQL